MTLAITLFILGVVCATVCGLLAPTRGRDAVGWSVLGFFFGPIPILILAALPSDPAWKAAPREEPQGASKLLIDLGPLLVFFLVNFLAPVPPFMKIFVATGAFMVAMVAAMLFSAIRYHRISPLLWFSGIMVVILGGLTIWLHNEAFIKMKPTIYYALVSALLWFGLWTDRPLLQRVLGSTYPGLDEAGWNKLTRNWAAFFMFMAVLNEAVWRNSTTNFWVGFKLWGALPLTFLFAAANIPMLLRHGLMKEDAVPAEVGPVE